MHFSASGGLRLQCLPSWLPWSPVQLPVQKASADVTAGSTEDVGDDVG